MKTIKSFIQWFAKTFNQITNNNHTRFTSTNSYYYCPHCNKFMQFTQRVKDYVEPGEELTEWGWICPNCNYKEFS